MLNLPWVATQWHWQRLVAEPNAFLRKGRTKHSGPLRLIIQSHCQACVEKKMIETRTAQKHAMN
jgi:hypothetical protein